LRRRTVVFYRQTTFSSEAPAKACLGAQASLGRKVLLGKQSIKQTRAFGATWRSTKI